MKKLTILIVFSLLFSLNSFAQYTTDWVRPADNYMKNGVFIARDSLDNVIVTGYIQSENIYTRKYNKFGLLLWEKISSSGTPKNYEKPVWTSIDKDNNAIVVGYRYTIGSGRDYPNAIVVLKYHPSGSLLWKKNIAVSVLVGSSIPVFNLRSEVDNLGNIYIGTAAAAPSGFVLCKLNSSGVTVFTRNSTVNSPNGFASMRLRENRIVVTGRSANLSQAPVIAWDTAGNVLWTRAVLGNGGSDIEIDAAANAYLLTSYPNQVSSASGQDISIYKFSSTGAQQWKKNFDFGGTDFPTRFTLIADKISAIGYGPANPSAYYFDWLTFQINLDGALIWNSRYDAASVNHEMPAYIAANTNGEVYVTGKGGPLLRNAAGTSFLRMITLKYSNTGVTNWIDSVNVNSGFGIACTLAKDGSLFVLGSAYMTAIHFIDITSTQTCAIPSGISFTNHPSFTTVTWSAVEGANLDHVRYKTASATTFTVVSTNVTSTNLAGLSGGTTYTFGVEAVCNSGPSGYSASQSFITPGTGYCTTGGESTALEYLSMVWIGNNITTSQNDNGYGDFTNVVFSLTQGQNVIGYLSGRVPFPEYENYSIWIDYNRDGDFTDAGEQVVNFSSNYQGYIQFSFTVPQNIPGGRTRMRVTQSFGVPASPCGAYPRGETEDYTVDIPFVLTTQLSPANRSPINESNTPGIFPNPVNDVLYVRDLPSVVNTGYVEIYDMQGRKLISNKLRNNSVNVSGLVPGVYLIKVRDNNSIVYSTRFMKK